MEHNGSAGDVSRNMPVKASDTVFEMRCLSLSTQNSGTKFKNDEFCLRVCLIPLTLDLLGLGEIILRSGIETMGILNFSPFSSQETR